MINILSLIWMLFVAIVALHWAIVSCFVIIGVIGAAFYIPKQGTKKAENVEFVIVSKASKGVRGVLFNCIDYHSKRFKDYTIDLVIDEGSELEKEMVAHIKKYKNVALYIVPANFGGEAIAKGRAMNHYIFNKPIDPRKWYCFIDDDNRVMDDKFLYEIPVHEKEGCVAANGILLPRYSNNKITYVADFLRYFDDLTIFRFLTGVLQRPLNGFHGELMIVKGEILQKIGFDRKTITEDFAFARELDRYEHKVWQSQTITSILSPHTIKEFIKQRNRWHKGISNDVWDGTDRMKIVAGLRSIDLFIAILGSWVIFPLWFFMHLPLWLIAFDAIGGGYYWIVYIYGATKLREITPYWFLYAFLIPIYSVMEVVVPHYKSKEEHFHVIHKSG